MMNSGDLVFVASKYFFPLYDLSDGRFRRFTNSDNIIVITVHTDTHELLSAMVTVLCYDGVYKVPLTYLLNLIELESRGITL